MWVYLARVGTRGVQSVLVLVGIIVVTSISIDATDTFSTSQSALGILARFATTETCPADMVTLRQPAGVVCVDRYEAGVGSGCSIKNPASDVDTAVNSNESDCLPISQAAVVPWRQVTAVQAVQLCARAGKQLLSAAQWYAAAAGTPDSDSVCALKTSLRPTGADPRCVSGIGAVDMVGNVWEFVSDSVEDTYVATSALPASGYVSAVSAGGLPSHTSRVANVSYNKDYFWSTATGSFAVLRGGFYGSGSDGGIYSTHADIAADFASAAVGFRCAKALGL